MTTKSARSKDAALLALGKRLDKVTADLIEAQKHPPSNGDERDAQFDRLTQRLADLVRPIIENYTPTSLAGFAVQARAASVACSEYWDPGMRDHKHEGSLDVERVFIEAVCRYAGVAPIYYLEGVFPRRRSVSKVA